ncbi:MAG: hypothetical protein QXI58_01850 [Candidatus Micrarchaeia archaeon]
MKLLDAALCVECEEIYNLRTHSYCPSCGCSQRLCLAWYIPSESRNPELKKAKELILQQIRKGG